MRFQNRSTPIHIFFFFFCDIFSWPNTGLWQSKLHSSQDAYLIPSHRCYGLKAESHMNWTRIRASPSFQSTRSHVSSSHSPLSPTTVVSWHLFPNYPQPPALTLWPSGLRDSLPSSPPFTNTSRSLKTQATFLLPHFSEPSSPEARFLVSCNLSDPSVFLTVANAAAESVSNCSPQTTPRGTVQYKIARVLVLLNHFFVVLLTQMKTLLIHKY